MANNARPRTTSHFLKLVVLAAYAAIFYLVMPGWLGFVLFSLGVVAGAGLLAVDEKYGRAWYQEKDQPNFLVTRSPLFVLSLIPLSIMVFTSFGSLWASGLIGGMMLFLLLEMSELRRDSAAFDKRFLPTIKGEVQPRSIQLILLVGWTYFFLIHLTALI